MKKQKKKEHQWFCKTTDPEGDARYEAEREDRAAAEGLTLEEYDAQNLAEFRKLPLKEKLRAFEAAHTEKALPLLVDWPAPKSAGNLWYAICPSLDQLLVAIGTSPCGDIRWRRTAHPLITKATMPDGLVVAYGVKKASRFRCGKSNEELHRLAHSHFGTGADPLEIAIREGFLTKEDVNLILQNPPKKPLLSKRVKRRGNKH